MIYPPTLDNVRYEIITDEDLDKAKKKSMSGSPQPPKRVPESQLPKDVFKEEHHKKMKDKSPLKEKKPLTNTKIVKKKNKNRLKSLISSRMVLKAQIQEDLRAMKHQNSKSIQGPRLDSSQSTPRSHQSSASNRSYRHILRRLRSEEERDKEEDREGEDIVVDILLQ